jgi:hypothetical protein
MICGPKSDGTYVCRVQDGEGQNARVPDSAPIAALSRRIGRHQNLLTKREGANTQMDTSLMIGAPLGLGILIALGILFVVMSYLTQ